MPQPELSSGELQALDLIISNMEKNGLQSMTAESFITGIVQTIEQTVQLTVGVTQVANQVANIVGGVTQAESQPQTQQAMQALASGGEITLAQLTALRNQLR